jgi:hypothetical protein
MFERFEIHGRLQVVKEGGGKPQVVRHVVAAEHLPYGSDGGHSRFTLRQQVVVPERAAGDVGAAHGGLPLHTELSFSGEMSGPRTLPL